MNETAISLTDQHPSLDFRWAIPASDLMLSPEQLQRTMEHYHFPKTEECEFLQLQKQIKEVVQCRGILLALPDNMRQENGSSSAGYRAGGNDAGNGIR